MPWMQIRIRQNDANMPDPDPQNCLKQKLIWIWYRYLTYLIELLGDGVPDLCFGHVRGHVPIPHKVQVLATIPVDYDLFQDLPAAFRETTSLLLLRCHSCF